MTEPIYIKGYERLVRNATVHIELAKATGVEAAAKRAQRLDEDAHEMGEDGRNPSTGVYRLNASIAR